MASLARLRLRKGETGARPAPSLCCPLDSGHHPRRRRSGTRVERGDQEGRRRCVFRNRDTVGARLLGTQVDLGGWSPRCKERIMATKKLSLLLVGLLTCVSQPALTQGGGAGSSGAGTGGTASGAASPGTGRAGGQVGAPATTSGQKSGTPATSTNNRGTDVNAPSAASSGVSPGSGIGTAPNGRPIGSVGSGPGSPEQPHDVPERR